MLTLTAGRYAARQDQSSADIRAAQSLRHRCFRGRDGLDADRFDDGCWHLLVEDRATGALVACCRVQSFENGARIDDSYAAQFYDLSALAHYDAPMVEIGRFCISSEARDKSDILRLAWAMLTQQVEAEGVGMLFGCSSFPGTDATRYREVFAFLRAHHLSPGTWRPRIKTPDAIRFAPGSGRAPDARQALRVMPPLLRSYLAMGGWVSDHAVVDHDLNTLHVFTGLEVFAVPPARLRLLRALSAHAVC
ncbi:ornithine-acyl-ACP acyltransferase [Aliiroseovarius zhejiangensis]|uniref:L-ornithine N(alpha)-acyltransferase n=1 Tax=Aliiroseovarius zhejiangensis TaxID=1632025 RepID=A0ABQ3IL11_9RHOB|nr:GNAT family N-acetyltransferase [Aliiroseovarius zhejiangensis]GHE86941.1 ornithine-acyl-ACP acyltransferase [Aliiroseovarius zhejiangensis]